MEQAGNAYLNQAPLLIWVTGERLQEKVAPVEPRGRAFAPTGLNVLFTLLCKPHLAARPYREIAEWAGVAHGTVGWVMPDLLRVGLVAEIAGKRRVLDAAELLRQWAEAHIRTLRPKLLLRRFRAPTLEWWSTLAPRDYGYVLGGEAAAGRITRNLRPGTITVYGKKVEPRFIADHRLVAARDGEVEILDRFWHFDPDAELAPVPLIYADLIRTGDARCLETAKLLHDEFIAGFERAR